MNELFCLQGMVATVVQLNAMESGFAAVSTSSLQEWRISRARARIQEVKLLVP